MYRYIINRFLLVFPTLFGAATLVFILTAGARAGRRAPAGTA